MGAEGEVRKDLSLSGLEIDQLSCRGIKLGHIIQLHAIGGAASLIAQTVTRVLGVYKYDFGVPEAMWVIEVKDFPVVVTMDSHGGSQHAVIDQSSKKVLDELLAKA